MKDDLIKLCNDAVKGKIKAQDFYKTLDAIADDENCPDDIACVIEDCLMELDMQGGADRAGSNAVKECAKLALEELANV
ncbi:MAG: hypothetical protein J6I96_03590 [Oscillospiraceae bacterium]|nr:hypothetical protein [Oscillospiraceae bacterium]